MNEQNDTSEKSITAEPPVFDERPKIIAYGDSLTAGYGLDGWGKSYPALLQRSIDDGGYRYQVLNYGRSGDTAEDGLNRLWLATGVADIRIFILALGANDVAGGTKRPDEIKKNLAEIIRRVKEKNAKILLCGIVSPERYGAEYRTQIREMYERLAEENDVLLVPSLMQGVEENPKKLLPDGIHPNEEGAKIIEGNVFTALLPLLEKNVGNTKK